MARSIWSGALTVGLISVPVSLFAATRDNAVHFNQVHAACHARIKMPKRCSECDRDLTADEIVQGIEVGGRMLVFEEFELDAIKPESTKAIAIIGTIPMADVNPVRLEKTYYLAPDRKQKLGQLGQKAYHLLRTVLAAENQAVLAKITMRSAERMCIVQSVGALLQLSTLTWADEIVPQSNLSDEIDENVDLLPEEIAMGQLLIQALPSAVEEMTTASDTHREAIQALIERKAQGTTTAQPLPTVKKMAPPQIPDLTAVLKASIEAAHARTPVGV